MIRRTIHDIKISRRPDRSEDGSRPIKEKTIDSYERENYSSRESYGRRGTKRSGMGKFFMSFVVCVGVLVAGTSLVTAFFKKAIITVVPRHETVHMPLSFTIDVVRNTEDAKGLSYTVMALSDTLSVPIVSTESTPVERATSGTVIIYNNFSASPQKLVEETRFQAANGLIYKTAKGSVVTIPGISGKKPGQIEATLFAEKPGEVYNSELTDLTIPGFKGTPKYEKFYARSKTPFSGGFSGLEHNVDPAEMAEKVSFLKERLTARLESDAALQKTDDYFFFPDGVFVSFGEPIIAGNFPSTTVSLDARLTAFLFNTSDMARVLAQKLVEGYDGAAITIPNLDTLGFTVVSKNDISNPLLVPRITLGISGDPIFQWNIDHEAVVSQTKNTAKKLAPSVLEQNFPIESAKVRLVPFWLGTIPEDSSKIVIIENNLI